MNIPFQLPSTANSSDIPSWDGHVFILGDLRTPVLEYSENFSGWSDDLTALHEEISGDKHPIDIASRNFAISNINKYLSTTSPVIMEIGCSSGFLIKDLVHFFPNASIIGADVVKGPLYKFAKSFPGIPLIRFDLLKCPLPNSCIDILVMLNVLEHIDDDINALKQAFKLLKPGGYLIIEVPAGPYLYDSYDLQLHHFRRYSSSELRHKLIDAGFNVEFQSHLGFILYPAFIVVKLLNKWLPSRKTNNIVGAQASASSGSKLVRWAMNLESNYLFNFRLPFGIRTLALAKKPNSTSLTK